MISHLVVVSLLLTLCAVDGRRMSSRMVSTKYGSIRGLILPLNNKHLQPVEVFLGVPYASPPTGSLRFMPPVALTPWKGIRVADQLGPVCPQKFPDISNETAALQRMPRGRLLTLRRLYPFLVNQSEDCLYLNIYVPTKVGRDTSPRLPVMVYIHGESFEWNSGNPYDGSVLASFGSIVVVTINFRLGVFGFLSSEGESARGNFGILDQIAALHWIAGNIEFFGGDPNNVTIFGQGHGAAFVNFLMISPVAKGLFHRAIVQSGAALSAWALVRNPLVFTERLARALDCPVTKDLATIVCLQKKTVEEILHVELHAPDYLTPLGPTLDGIVIPSELPHLMYTVGDLCSRYDLLFGVTKFEGQVPFSAEDAHFGFEADKRDRLVRTFIANTYDYHLNEIFALLVNEYTDWTKPNIHPIFIRDATMELLGDAQIVAPLMEAGNCHARFNSGTFFYNFGYQSRDGDFPQRLGCVHGEELPYIFGAPLVEALGFFHQNYTKTERMLTEAVMRYWTNFAKSGDPNQPEKQTSVHGGRIKNRFVKITWPHYDIVQQKYLSIGMRPKIRHHYRAHKLSIWTKLIPEIHVPGGDGVSMRHHLFTKHDDPNTFEGNVRQVAIGEFPPQPPATPTYPSPMFPSRNTTPLLIPSLLEPMKPKPTSVDGSGEGVARSPSHGDGKNGSEPLRVEAISPGGYSTALSVTIAVGCSLLILNVLIFAGVYYQRDKNRLEAKIQKRSPPTRMVGSAKPPPEEPPVPPTYRPLTPPKPHGLPQGGHHHPLQQGQHPHQQQQPPLQPPIQQQQQQQQIQQQQQQQPQPQHMSIQQQQHLRAPPPSPVGQETHKAEQLNKVSPKSTGGHQGQEGSLPESQPLLAQTTNARVQGRQTKMQEIRV